jgi:hypothetical protein
VLLLMRVVRGMSQSGASAPFDMVMCAGDLTLIPT